jgi:hypothetical protein
MANQKLFYEEGISYTKGATLALVIPIGATGAPGTPVLSNGFAATPLTRTGAGLYTLTLKEPWANLLWYSILTVQATVAAGDGLNGIITSTASLATAGTLTFTMLNNSSAAADPRNPSTLQILLGLKNNSNFP